MKTKYKNKYILDLSHLEEIIYSQEYYGMSTHPYDTINVAVDINMHKDNIRYLMLASVSTTVAKDIKNYNRSLTMSDLLITFIDSPNVVKLYPRIINENIRTFPFKNIYDKANNIINNHMKEYLCARHIVTMTDIGYDKLLIDIESLPLLQLFKLKLNSIISKRPKYTTKVKTVDSFYNIDL